MNRNSGILAIRTVFLAAFGQQRSCFRDHEQVEARAKPTASNTPSLVPCLRRRWRECQRIDDGVPGIIVSEFYKAGNALVRFNHPCRNCGNL
jgi:hypothetical protein